MEIKDKASRITLKSSVGTAPGDVSLFCGGEPEPALDYESIVSEHEGSASTTDDSAVISYADGAGICRIVCARGKLSIERANLMEIIPGKVTLFRYETPLGTLDGAALGVAVGYDVTDGSLTIRAEYYSEIKGTDIQSVKTEITAEFQEGRRIS